MLLSVITPDNQPGMAQMLEKELNGIDAEIIINNWDDGLRQAKGNFVCLLEKNSAVKSGTIRENLAVFTEKPAYRKLAMVSPLVDIDAQTYVLAYEKGLTAKQTVALGSVVPARIGCIPGSIIRASSLKKYPEKLDTEYPIQDSSGLSIFFWENGLRICRNPDTLYYAPEDFHSGTSLIETHVPSSQVLDIWQHEMIS